MKTTNVSASDFFYKYEGKTMVSGESVGDICGFTKNLIVLGLNDKSGVPYNIIPLQSASFFASMYDSYCFVNPDSSLLVENWVREQHRANFRHGVTLVAVAAIEIITLLIFGVL